MSSYGNGLRNRPDYRAALGLFSDEEGDRRRSRPQQLGEQVGVTRRGCFPAVAAAIAVAASLAGLAGCAPAVTAKGLPRVSRYAGPAQLDWMLARSQPRQASSRSSPSAWLSCW